MALSAQDYIILSNLNHETKQTNKYLIEIVELLKQMSEKLDVINNNTWFGGRDDWAKQMRGVPFK
jgi:hypothetical protein